uniref:Uncharacterized protein n=1 Tax=Erpetoichthys calabaricus TaxID=27687 RepID=A0A8C4TCT8_ERPCA
MSLDLLFLPSILQSSSSSDSLDGRRRDCAKSYDAVVFDVLKVTPEEFAVSCLSLCWLSKSHAPTVLLHHLS